MRTMGITPHSKSNFMLWLRVETRIFGWTKAKCMRFCSYGESEKDRETERVRVRAFAQTKYKSSTQIKHTVTNRTPVVVLMMLWAIFSSFQQREFNQYDTFKRLSSKPQIIGKHWSALNWNQSMSTKSTWIAVKLLPLSTTDCNIIQIDCACELDGIIQLKRNTFGLFELNVRVCGYWR